MKEDDKVESDLQKNKHEGSEDSPPDSIASEKQERGTESAPNEVDSGKNKVTTLPDGDARENNEDTIGIP